MPTIKKALVTGAGGFIGHHLVRRLVDDGVEVSAFLRYTSAGHHGLLERLPAEYQGAYEPHLGDLRDFEAVRRAMRGSDTVFHLAALIGIPYSYVSPADVAAVNVGGTLNVLQAARDLDGPRVVVTSTSEVYGTAQTVPITEGHPLHPQSPYAATKIGADQLALSFHRSFALPVAVCRPFNTFGPGQSQRAVIPTIITQAMMSDRIELGSLHPTRDMNYVENTADAFVTMARSDRSWGETVQFGSGREISIGDLARLILQLMGRDLPVESRDERVRPAASEVERLIASNERAAALYGWRPAVGLEEGLRRTIAWMQDNRDFYNLRGYSI
jgi:NAD dependent epimerase/dehydratase